MPEASNSILIRRPVGEVFAFLADAENDKRWRPGVVEIRRRSGSGAGTVYEQRVKGPFGSKVRADVEIVDLEPERRIGFRTIADRSDRKAPTSSSRPMPGRVSRSS
jgi:uncharacterized protein YndB with AHSA1/START domain